MIRLVAILAWLGFRHWQDVDNDAGWTLQRCAWTGKFRTVVCGHRIRQLKPGRVPWWEVPEQPQS